MDGFVEFLRGFVSDMFARTDGPMTFRFFLQPTMALITALIDGIKDAKTGRTPYFWRATHGSPEKERAALREGFTATARILLLGVAMDVIYQIKVFGGFNHPLETLVIAVVLGFFPYLLLRGPVERIAKHLMKRTP